MTAPRSRPLRNDVCTKSASDAWGQKSRIPSADLRTTLVAAIEISWRSRHRDRATLASCRRSALRRRLVLSVAGVRAVYKRWTAADSPARERNRQQVRRRCSDLAADVRSAGSYSDVRSTKWLRRAAGLRRGMVSVLKKCAKQRASIGRHRVWNPGGRRRGGDGWPDIRCRRRASPFEMQFPTINDALDVPPLHRDVRATDEALRRADGCLGQFSGQ